MLFETFIINIATFVLSLLVIVGLSIWNIENDIYIYLYSHSYEFLWFLVIFNMILSISIIGLTIYKKSRTYIETQLYELGKLVYIIFTPAILILSVCWLAISASIAKIANECSQFKNLVKNDHFINNFTCTGEIMISIFGFVLFIIYGSLFLFNAIELIKILMENYKYNQHTQNEINEQTQQTEELQQISTRNSSLQQITNVA